MNCRIFEMQVADWLAGRLPERIADQMAAHKAACPACASLTEREAEIRRLIADVRTPSASADLWPRIAARIDDRQASAKLGWRFAFGGIRVRSLTTAAVALAVLAPVVFVLNVTSKTNTVAPRSTPPKVAHNIPTPETTGDLTPNMLNIDASLVSDPQSDPSIDDPIGGAMEHVWTQVSTDSKDAGH